MAIVRHRVIDEDAAHHLRCNGQEVGAVLPFHGIPFEQPQIGFVDQSRRLERVAHLLSAQIQPSQAAQFLLDERRQLLQRLGITPAPGLQ
jgi:hypothetical protein